MDFPVLGIWNEKCLNKHNMNECKVEMVVHPAQCIGLGVVVAGSACQCVLC